MSPSFPPPSAAKEKIEPESFTTLFSTGSFRVERIVSQGHRSPDGFWYDQDEHEWVMLLQGDAAIEIEGDTKLVVLKTGAHLNIPARTRHRVAWTSTTEDTVWLAIFYSSASAIQSAVGDC